MSEGANTLALIETTAKPLQEPSGLKTRVSTIICKGHRNARIQHDAMNKQPLAPSSMHV